MAKNTIVNFVVGDKDTSKHAEEIAKIRSTGRAGEIHCTGSHEEIAEIIDWRTRTPDTVTVILLTPAMATHITLTAAEPDCHCYLMSQSKSDAEGLSIMRSAIDYPMQTMDIVNVLYEFRPGR